MAAGPRIVAELGRPETPEETAARKAESSRVYRSSQTFRNLIAALLITVAVVAVVYLGVPRGTPPEPEPVDVPAAARSVATSLDRTVIVPEVPGSWRANSASVVDGAWRVVYAPPSGFVHVAQGFDADGDWPARLLGGYAPTDEVIIDGITWDTYSLPGDAGIRYALVTPAGPDTIAVYGSVSPETAAEAASGLTDQIRSLQKEEP
jgi:hypothetical protein